MTNTRTTCAVEDCDEPCYCKGWCRKHYAKFTRKSRANPNPKPKPTEADRFWAKVTPGTKGCLIWRGATDGQGRYGSFQSGGKLVRAHRWAYEQAHGPIPDGLKLDHICRVTVCVNAKHLQAVTQQENILRGVSPTAINARKTHCEKGHPLTGENLRTWGGRGRYCLTCHRESCREATRRWRDRQRNT